ncbi:hypothetical protein R3P38DRAFT_2558667 [Favolaschia claudopus]|uniref:Uncharacterized protein n=1 Tax=Favolaschia claudopus TaxID=2862362 RepID=A0AAW0A6I7_9AGAR
MNELEGTIPTTIPSEMDSAWAAFLSRVVQVHSPTTACHAATEVFLIDEKIVTLLLCLREDLDFTPNYYNARSAVTDFDFSTTVIAAPSSLALPVSWVKYQVSAGDVQNPRMKSSLWTFGALPCTSHVPDSTSFRWLKQTWNTVSTRDGTLNVIDISSGEPTLPLPRVHELRARLTHPANLSNRLLVHASIDTEYQRLIEDECEDWIIAAGYTTCPHFSMGESCQYQDSTYESAAKEAHRVCLQITDSQTGSEVHWTSATVKQRQWARHLGRLHHLCRHAYGLLSNEEYDKYHSVTFPALTNLRPLFVTLPAAVIWNYVEPGLKAQALMYRLEHPLS